jgi:hypothetical protein
VDEAVSDGIGRLNATIPEGVAECARGRDHAARRSVAGQRSVDQHAPGCHIDE